MNDFSPASEEEVLEIIMNCPPKHCDLDPIPTCLLKNCIDILLPTVTNIINESLSSGTVPNVFKMSIVKPLLKKNDLDVNEYKNYRPVSNLSFLSKVLERLVLKRLSDHIQANNLSHTFQSAYKTSHSTETALLKICTDILTSLDENNVCLLTLLDLSAAFDTIDHDILLNRLNITFGISGNAINWFHSYLNNRRQVVKINEFSSQQCLLKYGVPQGSVLGPVLFTIYIQPLSEVFLAHNMNYHGFADDHQLYKFDIVNNIPLLIKSVEDCTVDIKNWMQMNKLKLNDDKTEVMLCTRDKMKNNNILALNINGSTVQSSSSVKNLGVVIDNCLSMNCQIDNLCRSMIIKLKMISTIRDYITKEVAAKLVVTLVLSQLDYCNSLISNITQDKLKRLQVIQNSAAKLVTRQRRSAHSMPLLLELHWLPVTERINYKIAMICFKCVNGLAPNYIADFLEFYEPRRNLRSSSDKTILKQTVEYNYKFYGGRSFRVIGPLIWNSLPRKIREANSLDSFKKMLKHHYFKSAFF